MDDKEQAEALRMLLMQYLHKQGTVCFGDVGGLAAGIVRIIVAAGWKKS